MSYRILLKMNGWKTYRRVVQDGPDISIFDLIEWVDGLDAVVEQLMEHKADTCTTRQLVQREVARVTIDRCPELRAELRAF